jgi:hypothetical protein
LIKDRKKNKFFFIKKNALAPAWKATKPLERTYLIFSRISWYSGGVENLSLWDPAPEGATAPLDAQQLRLGFENEEKFLAWYTPALHSLRRESSAPPARSTVPNEVHIQ